MLVDYVVVYDGLRGIDLLLFFYSKCRYEGNFEFFIGFEDFKLRVFFFLRINCNMIIM